MTLNPLNTVFRCTGDGQFVQHEQKMGDWKASSKQSGFENSGWVAFGGVQYRAGFVKPVIGSSSIAPAVLTPRILFTTYSQANRFCCHIFKHTRQFFVRDICCQQTPRCLVPTCISSGFPGPSFSAASFLCVTVFISHIILQYPLLIFLILLYLFLSSFNKLS